MVSPKVLDTVCAPLVVPDWVPTALRQAWETAGRGLSREKLYIPWAGPRAQETTRTEKPLRIFQAHFGVVAHVGMLCRVSLLPSHLAVLDEGSVRATSCIVALQRYSTLRCLPQRLPSYAPTGGRKGPGGVLCASSAALSAASACLQRKLVKICGITSEADAEVAAAAGADLLGMIMWQRGRRAVTQATARSIAAVAHRHGVQVLRQPQALLIDKQSR